MKIEETRYTAAVLLSRNKVDGERRSTEHKLVHALIDANNDEEAMGSLMKQLKESVDEGFSINVWSVKFANEKIDNER